jgi:hypothetical protein
VQHYTRIDKSSKKKAKPSEVGGFFVTSKTEGVMEHEIERRTIDLTEIRLIAEGDQKPLIRGYAAVFDKFSSDLGGFIEKIARGAFQKSLKSDDVRALFNHDANYVLGRTKPGTLRLSEDDKGLAIEIDPPDTQWARDLQVSIDRGDISQMSFGFRVVADDWKHVNGKPSERTLTEVRLFDVSPVTFPAYPQTTVKVRDYLNSLGREGVPETVHVPDMEALRFKIR